MAEKLKQVPSILDAIVNTEELPEGLNEKLRSSITVKSVKKGDLLQRRGDNAKLTYFVLKGCLRSYHTDEKEKEHIFMFAPEGWIISDIESQTNNAPAMLYIDALEDSEVECFDKDFFAEAAKLVPGLAAGNNNRLLRRISVLQKRIIMLMSASALERYQDFINTYPDIVQRVPQKMIASYLGVTPEALSKIRNKLTGRNKGGKK